MRILFLAPHLSTGGMPQFLLKRIQALKASSNAEILVVEYNVVSTEFIVQKNKIKNIVELKSLGQNKSELLSIIDDFNPDIIHIDEMSERLDVILMRKIYNPDRRYRIVETCHDVSFDPNSKVLHPDLFMFCTPYHEKTFADLYSKFVTVQYPIENYFVSYMHKYNCQEKLGWNHDVRHVLNVGLWTPGKNQAEGLEIARNNPDFHFHFVGNLAGNFINYWEPLVEIAKDLPNVTIHGEKENVFLYLAASDIFMFNSTWECNPLAIREAIAYKLPIIARNLPQYEDMFKDSLLPIETDLKSIKPNSIYDIDNSLDNSTINEAFANNHLLAYDIIRMNPAQKQSITINQHFVDNPYLETKGFSDSDFRVKFFDEKGQCHYDNTIRANNWVKLNRQYFTRWVTKVYENGRLIYSSKMDLKGKNVYIVIDSKSLGDTIAWMPYALEFKNRYGCNVTVSTFHNHLFDYPELTFVEPESSINCYALYRVGWKWNTDQEPVQCNTIPLQQVATNILGLPYKELKPKIKSLEGVASDKKYVTIATNSTMECKFWTREGWQEVINHLHNKGYDVINVSKEDNPFENCTKIHDTSIEFTIRVISSSEFFIGLSSGLSWLAWALNKQVIMIANFSEADHEFDCIRITNPDVCNGCWNDPNIKLDPYWLWCPRNKNFECQRSIPASYVISALDHIE
jgi:autotransporter strand-loop-strand O-heptosyltransferase